jgi:uncharacterized phage protein (TIGR01671 family)
MARQNKFRVWSKQSKRFIKSDYFAIGLDGTLIQHNICYSDDPDDTWDDSWNEELDDEKHEVQQFTGLLDKNGVEIYEGDILSKNWRCEVFTCGNRGTFMVKFNNHPWKNKDMPLFDYLAARQKAWMSENNEDCEIIGNIFENPELLAN